MLVLDELAIMEILMQQTFWVNYLRWFMHTHLPQCNIVIPEIGTTNITPNSFDLEEMASYHMSTLVSRLMYPTSTNYGIV